MGGPAMTSGGSAGLAASFLYRKRAAESIWSVCTEICMQLRDQHVLLAITVSERRTCHELAANPCTQFTCTAYSILSGPSI